MAEAFIPLSAMSLVRKKIGDHTFLIETPTQRMKDQLGLRLYELGVIPVSTEQFRAATVTALFEVFDEERADLEADFLRGLWNYEDEFAKDHALWQEREVQRLLDRMENGVKKEPYPEPTPEISQRDAARSVTLIDELNEQSSRFRRAQSRRIDYARASNAMIVRVTVKGVVDDTIEVEREKDGPSGVDLLTETSLENIHKALGAEFVQLLQAINVQYGLSKEEEKNFDSPAGNGSPPSGSESQSASPASSDGSLTALPTGRTRKGGSGKTTGKSSASISRTKAPIENTGQTAEA